MTRTNAEGFYEITRADGIVNSNRNWFVLGPDNTHSKTIHELVAAEVTLSSASASATTAQTVNFTGTVFPAHVHQRVLLQEQNSTSGNGWKTIDFRVHGRQLVVLGGDHRFREAGSYSAARVLPGRPAQHRWSQSATRISQTIEQEQNPSFTINASSQAPVVTNGQSETITGTAVHGQRVRPPRCSRT